eukprot:g11449.t1
MGGFEAWFSTKAFRAQAETAWEAAMDRMRGLTSTTAGQSTSRASRNLASKKLIVMCGPSGAGKSSLVKKLMKEYPSQYGFSVSHTTRAPRPGEKDGVDYHYVAKEVMEAKIQASEMLEYAHVHSNIYGTSIEAVEQVMRERRCILDIDVQGVDSVKRTHMNSRTCYIFVAPPDLDALEKRLRSRGTETEEKIQTRLRNARTEMEYKDKPKFWDAVLVNDDLERAYAELKSLLQPKEESRATTAAASAAAAGRQRLAARTGLIAARLLTLLVGPAAGNFVIFTSPTDKAVRYVKTTASQQNAVRDLITDGLQNPHGISLDAKTSQLYVTDTGAQKVWQYDLSQSGADELVVANPLEAARNIEAYWSAVDARNRTMYLTERTGNFICKVDLENRDGSCRVAYQGVTTANPIGLESMQWPAGIDVDGYQLFFGNGQNALATGSIMSAPLKVPTAPSLTKLPNQAITDVVQGVCTTASNVFYTDGASNLFAMKKWGGTPLAVSTALKNGMGCTYDGDGAVYIVDKENLWKIPANMKTVREIYNLEKVVEAPGAVDVVVFAPTE